MSSIAQTAPAGHRRDLFWIAALIHRISGVLLACFLPFHFLALALALERLRADSTTSSAWTERPLIQIAEAALVFLLTVHLLGGLRLLLIDTFAWRPGRRELVALAFGTAAIVALGFYIGLHSTMIERLQTDILILGAGGAGLFAALHAHQANPTLDIIVASKGLLGKCGCTRMVQGGYNVALHQGDSVERHFMDTIEGGKWLPNQELAWTLVTKAIERVQRIGERGRLFLRSQCRRHAARQGFRRPDLRPHRAQRRPDRHRDHQPPDGAGLGAAASAGWRNIARSP